MIALNAVLLVLVAAIAAETVIGGRELLPSAAEDPPTFDPFRAARVSLGSAADLETNFGGSGEDTLVEVLPYGGQLYIFGNTTSSDFDCEGGGPGAFVAALDGELKISFRAFFGEGETLRAAIPAEGGFLTATERDGKVMLRLLDPTGEVVAAVNAGSVIRSEVCALRLLDGKYALVTSSAAAPLEKRKLLLQLYDYSLALRAERLLASPYSLTFIELFEAGGNVTVFFNAAADIGRLAGAAVCPTSGAGEPVLTYISGGGDYVADSVVPRAGGWALSVRFASGDGGILLADGAMKRKEVMFSAEPSPTSSVLLYGDGTYYSSFLGASRTTAAYDETFSSARELTELAGMTEVYMCLSKGGCTLFACSDGEAMYAVSVTPAVTLRFGSAAMSDLRLVQLGDRVYAVACSTKKDADVGNNFGSSDVWLARLRI